MIPIRDTIPSRNPAIVLYMLLAANLAMFFYELTLSQEQLDQFLLLYGVVPARYTHPSWAREVGFPMDPFHLILPFFSCMFLHGGWMHIIGNMWSLWIFGDNVEDRMGPFRFLIFYLLGGLLAGVAHVITNPSSQMPTVGASGAIAAVLGAYFLLFPRASVVVMVPILFYPLFFAVPAILYLGFWILSQVGSGFGSLVGPKEVGGVAWWAHIGGFVAGMVISKLFLPSEPKRHPWQRDEYGIEGAWRPEQRLLR